MRAGSPEYAALLFVLVVSFIKASLSYEYRSKQRETRNTLKWAAEFAALQQSSWRKLPETLEGFDDARLHEALDGWGRPLVYESSSKEFAFISYGRDGKLGGVGLDCDLTHKRPDPPEARPVFSRFLQGRHAGWSLFGSGLTGMLVLGLCWFTIKTLSRRSMVWMVVEISGVIVGTCMLVVWLAGLHACEH